MKIFINKRIAQKGITLLEEAGLDVTIAPKNELSRYELDGYLKNCDALLAVSLAPDKNFFSSYPNIKAVALHSVGFNNVDIKEATRKKIPIGNTPGVLTKATSDIAFLLMQFVARWGSYYFLKVKDGRWGSFDPLENLGQELYGKTIGILGLGRIGFEMARKCKDAFGMNVIYHNRHQNVEAGQKLGARYVSFETLVKESDVISIHASYSEEDAGLFNADIFSQMKPTAILINTARGGFIREDDLYEALVNGKIWAAGLDVTHPEPMCVHNPLLRLPNVCVFPHIGSATIEAREGMSVCAAENLIAWSQGKQMPHLVNPEIYGK